MSSRENLDLVQDVMQQMCAQFDAEGVKGEAIIHSIAAQKRDIASLSAMKNARSKKLIQSTSRCSKASGRLDSTSMCALFSHILPHRAIPFLQPSRRRLGGCAGML
jgi:hypothetical protein